MIKSPSIAYEAGRLIKNIGGDFYGVTGYNSGAAGFVLVHDVNATPADGQIPDLVVGVAANAPFSIGFPYRPYPMKNGIYVCFSSTGPTKTIGGAQCWFNPLFD